MYRAQSIALAFAVILLSSAFSQEDKKAPSATSDLPGKGKIEWNVAGLSDRFTLVKTKYEPEARKVTWLVEAKNDLSIKPAELTVGLFDDDKVRLTQDELQVEGGIADAPPVNPTNPLAPFAPTPIKVQKGERVRIVLNLPDEDVWDKVRFVMVGSKAIPTEGKSSGIEKK